MSTAPLKGLTQATSPRQRPAGVYSRFGGTDLRQGNQQVHYGMKRNRRSPRKVARLPAARLIALTLGRCLERHQTVRITWPCRLCEQPHSADLLADVGAIRERHPWRDWTADVALLDANQDLRAVITLGPSEPDMLRACAASAIATLAVTPDRLRGQPFSLTRLLTGAIIYGGACATQQELARQDIAADIPALRALLATAALREPHYAYGTLEAQGGVTHVLTLDERRLWLPPALWQRAVGGVLHTISPSLKVITQEWRQDDGATVALYYVSVKDACAVAVRRFAPGEPVQSNLANVSLRAPKTAALQIASGFARA